MSNTKSTLVSCVVPSPNNSGPRAYPVTRITPHCMVGQLSAKKCGDLFARSSYQASSNYGIGTDGEIGLYVDETKRSWCSSNADNDNRAITIECASNTISPYAMNSKVYASLVKLCVDICQRYGKTKLIWFGDKNKSLAYKPKENEMVLTVHRWFAQKSCVPVDTEVLTKDGWIRLSDIHIGDEIACADLDNLRITFEEVYDMVPERDQDTYTNNGFTATKDHRCVYSTHGSTIYRIEDYKHLLASGNQIYIPLAGHADFPGWNITDSELKLLIAVQADGHYMHEPRSKEDPYIGLEFHLKKDRKVQRIKEILHDCSLDFVEREKSDGSVSIRVWGKEIVDECEKYLTNKRFNWNWLYLSAHQARVFLSEILRWDGCEASNLYTSKDKINLDVVSAIAAINGVGGNVTGSNIKFRESPFCTLSKDKEGTRRNSKSHGTTKSRVSCVSVKTGVFLIRQNGKTFITGNCPGDWLYSRLGKLAEQVTEELEGADPAADEKKEEKTGKLYRVQCGAFSKIENAEKRVQKLKAAGFDAVIVEE